jgi:two-component system NtrC family response regulator
LAHFFLGRCNAETGRQVGLSVAALQVLEAQRWPGNVRELENVLRRASVFAKDEILPEDLGLKLGG